MKIVILGVNGYIGRHIKNICQEKHLDFFGINREQVDFGSKGAYESLCRILDNKNPKLIINCVGAIDGKNINPNEVFNSIFLPTFYLYQYFKNKLGYENIYVWIFGSNSAGKPRRNYPVYAALKNAEIGLLETAKDELNDKNIKWLYTVLPRLTGGLGAGSKKLSSQRNLDFSLIYNHMEETIARIRKDELS